MEARHAKAQSGNYLGCSVAYFVFVLILGSYYIATKPKEDILFPQQPRPGRN